MDNMTGVLKKLDKMDYLTVIACLHHCARLHINSKERKEFQAEFGMAIDKHITQIMKRLYSK